jgi:putative transposase
MSIAYKIHKQDAAYFLTLQVVHWVDVFSRKRYRDILVESLNYCIKHKGFEVFAYVIMSNHVHLLARAGNRNLSDVLRDFKRHTSRMILNSLKAEPESRREWMLRIFEEAGRKLQNVEKYQVWTHENHAEEIFSPEFTLQKIKYIHENPVRAGIVSYPEHYLYSSACDYAGQKGLVKIERINLHLLMS